MTPYRIILSTFVLSSLVFGEIELVADPVAYTASLVLGPDTSPNVSLPAGSNKGDYWLDIDPVGTQDEGIIISSVAQNLAGGNATIASGYPSAGTAKRHFISAPEKGASNIPAANEYLSREYRKY